MSEPEVNASSFLETMAQFHGICYRSQQSPFTVAEFLGLQSVYFMGEVSLCYMYAKHKLLPE